MTSYEIREKLINEYKTYISQYSTELLKLFNFQKMKSKNMDDDINVWLNMINNDAYSITNMDLMVIFESMDIQYIICTSVKNGLNEFKHTTNDVTKDIHKYWYGPITETNKDYIVIIRQFGIDIKKVYKYGVFTKDNTSKIILTDELRSKMNPRYSFSELLKQN